MDRDALTPAQLRVVDELMALGQERPVFERDLAVRLRDQLEAGLAPAAEKLAPEELPWVNKDRLAKVHACEAHFLAETDFEWTARTARGSVVHKALELSVTLGDDAVPLELVDHAIETLKDDDRRASPGPWLADAPALDIAELRSSANDVVAKFFECWPPLQAKWIPRTETGIGVPLLDEKVMLWAKVDLLLGKPQGQQARTLVVDFKTRGKYARHLDDLRFYALVQAVRLGVPPFRVASYYLDTADFHVEDVDEDVLQSTVRRVIAGVTKMIELRAGTREPTITEGPQCSWCQLRDTCEGAVRWRARALDDGDEPI